jgi:hypothetical protein
LKEEGLIETAGEPAITAELTVIEAKSARPAAAATSRATRAKPICIREP